MGEGNELGQTYSFITENEISPGRFDSIPWEMAIRYMLGVSENPVREDEWVLVSGPLMEDYGLELSDAVYRQGPPDSLEIEFVDGAGYDWEEVYVEFDGKGCVTSIEFREERHRVAPDIVEPVQTLEEPVNGNGTTLRQLLSGEVDDQELLPIDTVPDHDDPVAAPERLKDDRESWELH